MVNHRLRAICNQLKPTVTEASLGKIEEIDARLEKAQAEGLILAVIDSVAESVPPLTGPWA